MKIKNFNEIMTIKNSSDMDNWSTDIKKVYSDNKIINYELGSKVLDLLNEYGLGVVGVGPGKWMNEQHLLIADEGNFQEYRVHIGKKQEWDDFISDYEIENDIEYKKLSKDEQEKIDEIYNKLPYEPDKYEEIEFSVFLPSKTQNLGAAAMSDASSYLKLLSDSKLDGIIEGSAEYHIFFDDTHEVKNFINGKNITITNKNLEDIKTISHRLYKDSKVFGRFIENIGESETKNLFNNWLKLI